MRGMRHTSCACTGAERISLLSYCLKQYTSHRWDLDFMRGPYPERGRQLVFPPFLGQTKGTAVNSSARRLLPYSVHLIQFSTVVLLYRRQ